MRLTLDRETVRELTGQETTLAAGGNATFTCAESANIATGCLSIKEASLCLNCPTYTCQTCNTPTFPACSVPLVNCHV